MIFYTPSTRITLSLAADWSLALHFGSIQAAHQCLYHGGGRGISTRDASQQTASSKLEAALAIGGPVSATALLFLVHGFPCTRSAPRPLASDEIGRLRETGNL